MKKTLLLLCGAFLLSGCSEEVYEYKKFSEYTCENFILRDIKSEGWEYVEKGNNATRENIETECGTQEEMQEKIDTEERAREERKIERAKEDEIREARKEKVDEIYDFGLSIEYKDKDLYSLTDEEFQNFKEDNYKKLIEHRIENLKTIGIEMNREEINTLSQYDFQAKASEINSQKQKDLREKDDAQYMRTTEGIRCKRMYETATATFCKTEIAKGTNIRGSVVAVVAERGIYESNNKSNYGSGDQYQYCWHYSYSPNCYYTGPDGKTIKSYN